MILIKTTMLAVLIVSWTSAIGMVQGAENGESDIELLRLKKELAQVRQERQKVREDAKRDKKDFAEYQQRFADKKASLSAETDSVKRVASAFEAAADSLAGLASAFDLQKKQYELLQDRFKDRLASACGRLIAIAKIYPPSVLKQCLGSLSFLLSDCTAKTIDNAEGLHRLAQIVQNMEEYSQSIQTGQETSPPPILRGAALMLRIGTVFEAVTDEDGKIGAIWLGNDSAGQPQWRIITNATQCAAILKAINIRDSKALPEFVDLPYLVHARKEARR